MHADLCATDLEEMHQIVLQGLDPAHLQALGGSKGTPRDSLSHGFGSFIGTNAAQSLFGSSDSKSRNTPGQSGSLGPAKGVMSDLAAAVLAQSKHPTNPQANKYAVAATEEASDTILQQSSASQTPSCNGFDSQPSKLTQPSVGTGSSGEPLVAKPRRGSLTSGRGTKKATHVMPIPSDEIDVDNPVAERSISDPVSRHSSGEGLQAMAVAASEQAGEAFGDRGPMYSLIKEIGSDDPEQVRSFHHQHDPQHRHHRASGEASLRSGRPQPHDEQALPGTCVGSDPASLDELAAELFTDAEQTLLGDNSMQK